MNVKKYNFRETLTKKAGISVIKQKNLENDFHIYEEHYQFEKCNEK